VQIVGGQDGFLFLTNRLMFAGRLGATRKHEPTPAEAAEALRKELHSFCADTRGLAEFYAVEQAQLQPARKMSEDPPELSI
jgi:hypothetical protein